MPDPIDPTPQLFTIAEALERIHEEATVVASYERCPATCVSTASIMGNVRKAWAAVGAALPDRAAL